MELEDNGIGDVIEMRGSVEAGPFLIGWTKESYPYGPMSRFSTS